MERNATIRFGVRARAILCVAIALLLTAQFAAFMAPADRGDLQVRIDAVAASTASFHAVRTNQRIDHSKQGRAAHSPFGLAANQAVVPNAFGRATSHGELLPRLDSLVYRPSGRAPPPSIS